MAIFALIVTLLLICGSASKPDRKMDRPWSNFKKTYQRQYARGEEDKKRKVFEDNMNEIIQHNFEFDMGIQTYRKGVNEFADLTEEEFDKYMSCSIVIDQDSKANSTFCAGVSANGKLPDTVDWRKKGLVTPVKDQRGCQSCWAFATTGVIEGQHIKKTGKFVSLSEQQLVDCAPNAEGTKGDCSIPGNPDLAYGYILKNGGIDTEECYPYVNQGGPCRYNPKCVGATITGYKVIPEGDEIALKAAVATIGPIALMINSNGLRLYKAGVFNDKRFAKMADVNHAVLCVGYGTSKGEDYWLIKNSWGENWGVKGYFRMARNKNNAFNVAYHATFPTV